MEVDYNMIIKYLVPKKNMFMSKRHIHIYSDNFSNKFKDILQNKFYRFGVTQVDNKNNNISLFTSLLTLLKREFVILSIEEEINIANKFRDILKITNDTIDHNNLLHISKILDINIIIFDFKDGETIKVINNDNICDPWKVTLLLANYENMYEPIIYDTNDKKLFSYNDQIIKKIYSNLKDIKLYELKDIINKIKNDYEPNTTTSSDESIQQIFSKEEKYTFEGLNKLTKIKLSDILNDKNIKFNSKILKKDMIELILSHNN
jgi:hypothetical protein